MQTTAPRPLSPSPTTKERIIDWEKKPKTIPPLPNATHFAQSKITHTDRKISLPNFEKKDPIVAELRKPLVRGNSANAISVSISRQPKPIEKKPTQGGSFLDIPPTVVIPDIPPTVVIPRDEKTQTIQVKALALSPVVQKKKKITPPAVVPRNQNLSSSATQPLPPRPPRPKNLTFDSDDKNEVSKESTRGRSISLPNMEMEQDDNSLEESWIVPRKDTLTDPPKLDSPAMKSIKKQYASNASHIFQRESQVFGRSLSEVLAGGGTVPNIIVRCVSWVRANALDDKGILRLSPDQETVNNFAREFNSGIKFDFDQMKDIDSQTVCGILKKYLRDLPPLLTEQAYTCFLAVHGMVETVGRVKSAYFSEEMYLKKISDIFTMIPESNIHMLKYLLDFLADVAEHSDKNGMTIKNIGIVMGPILLRTDEKFTDPQTMIADLNVINSICEYLILNKDDLFPNIGYPHQTNQSK
eukprot:TRINITY_DN7062_c0_g1_i2.p1 TRINITY_DN7062_c0_g1~~TRINITY_DN7062_c0_g1_i2.p1  ORF type:complete len:469 (+),score=105.61 TRINITY_DN7062_c0_g1_i2:52-1458(+)